MYLENIHLRSLFQCRFGVQKQHIPQRTPISGGRMILDTLSRVHPLDNGGIRGFMLISRSQGQSINPTPTFSVLSSPSFVQTVQRHPFVDLVSQSSKRRQSVSSIVLPPNLRLLQYQHPLWIAHPPNPSSLL